MFELTTTENKTRLQRILKNKQHIIPNSHSVRDALVQLNDLKIDPILIITDEEGRLIGSLTDGDLRRGFINGLGFENSLNDYIQPNPLYIYEDTLHDTDIAALRRRNFMIVPVIGRDRRVVDILNLRHTSAVLPVDVIIMAGGRGERLMPLTQDRPKPMLHVGDKPILEHNIDRLVKYGMKNIRISVNYLAQMIEDYFMDGSEKGVNISYIHEDRPMGTMGSVKLAQDIAQDYVMVMNSDVLTNIDFESFFKAFIASGADMAVATTSYHVDVPYGVLEVGNENHVESLKEKPRYTYYSNAGIYLMRKELLNLIPDDMAYNVTDLMELLLSQNKKLLSFPILGYWLDIGQHDDYRKAQEDIRHIIL